MPSAGDRARRGPSGEPLFFGMPIELRELHGPAIERVIPLLALAEPQEEALRWGLAHLSDTVYAVEDDGVLVGAVSMRWRGEPAEIEELAVAETRQGRGYGRAIVEAIMAEARRRGKRAVDVGTPNASIGNIAFYQKCGFRMERIRRDYFAYYEHYYGGARVENGIEVRDLVMFRRAVE